MECTLAEMLKKERSRYKLSPNVNIDEEIWRLREDSVTWMFDIACYFGLSTIPVSAAVWYFDRLVEKSMVNNFSEASFATLVCLQIALKVYSSVGLPFYVIQELGRNRFNRYNYKFAENRILRALDWMVHPPTSRCFLGQFFSMIQVSTTPLGVYELLFGTARDLVGMISRSYHSVSYPPSMIALTGLIISMERIDDKLLPTWECQDILNNINKITKIQSGDIDIIRQLVEVLEHYNN